MNNYGYNDLHELMTLMTGDEKHNSSATSTLDVIWTLYNSILNVSPETLDDDARDHFLLSKGHGPMAYYAVLAAKGFFPVSFLSRWSTFTSPLGYHPDSNLIPGVEVSSGSLGHGLPIAVGVALALKLKGNDTSRVVCLLGDAELEEGSNHEAIAFAGHSGLSQLSVIVIDNRSSTLGWPGGIGPRFEVAGWSSASVNGHAHDEIAEGFAANQADRPHVLVANVEAH